MNLKPRSAVLIAGLVPLFAGGLVVAVPTLRYAALVAAGRNYCSPDAIRSVSSQRAAREYVRKKLERAARVVARDGNLALWDVGGERYWMPAGSSVLPGMLAEQRTSLYDSAGQTVRPGDVVLDCGANIGLYTLAALERGASLVVAIEPALDNVECLRRNLAGYVASGRVMIYPKGVWDKDDLLRLNVQPSNSASYSVALRYRGSRTGPQVELTTIDELVRDLELTRVDYIKMDIEGAERQALRGAAATIGRFRPRMTISMEHRFDDPLGIPQLVSGMFGGYKTSAGRCIETGASLRPAVVSFYTVQ
ncbi:MAG: FkbM family methyltransferase [Bryobacteraceae bacterium]